MQVFGQHFRSIWFDPERSVVHAIDQTRLPGEFKICELSSVEDVIDGIRRMVVRGAPLIGATAAYGMVLAMREDSSDRAARAAASALVDARPTAVNLAWAVHRMMEKLLSAPRAERAALALHEAQTINDEDTATNSRIGDHGLALIQSLLKDKPRGTPLRILTHCNAGWLATVDWGTALAPIYKAHEAGLPVFVWVDETRPRNQGAALTTWELSAQQIPHRLVTDNAGGLLMQRGEVDLCLVGCDRLTRTGDLCNKIGTYLKALAAHDNGVPFYTALPTSTIDWTLTDGPGQIPIEERAVDEVLYVTGNDDSGHTTRVRIAPAGTDAANPAFDVTPARLVEGIITEHGICDATEGALATLPTCPTSQEATG